MPYTSVSNGTTWTVNGMIIDAERGDRPKEASQALLSTKAVEIKDGWVGQIVMSGEIVYETKPQAESEDALEEVNKRIQARFKRMIVGS